jgi:hypothetical protein
MLGVDQRVLKIVWTVCVRAGVALIYAIRDALILHGHFLALLLSPLVSIVDHFVRAGAADGSLDGGLRLMIARSRPFSWVSLPRWRSTRSLLRLPDALRNDPLAGIPCLPGSIPRVSGWPFWMHEQLNQLGNNALALIGQGLQQLFTKWGRCGRRPVPILAFFLLGRQKLRDSSFIAWTGSISVVHRSAGSSPPALPIPAKVLSWVAFAFYAVFLSLTGAPYAVLLAGSRGFLEFIPAVGPFVAMVIIGTVGLFSGYPLVPAAALPVVYRVAQDYILQPLLLSSGMRIHPLLIIFGILAGGELGGVPGIFFSIPLIAALRLIFLRLWKQELLERIDAT